MGHPLFTSGTEALPEIADSDDPDLVANAFRRDAGAVGELQIAQDQGFAETVGAFAEAHRSAVGAIQRNITALQEAVELSAQRLEACGDIYEEFRSHTVDSAQSTHEDNRLAAKQELDGILEQIEAADLRGEDTSALVAHYETRKEALIQQLKDGAKSWDDDATEAQNEIGTLSAEILSVFETNFGSNAAVQMGDEADSSYRIDQDDLLVNMFGENSGVLEVYAHMEDAIADSRDAVNLFNGDIDPNTGMPTAETMEQFMSEYGTRMWEDPYFANAFAQEFGAENMAEFAARVASYNVNVAEFLPAEKLELYEQAVASMGTTMMIATGSVPTDITEDYRADLFHEWKTYAGDLKYNDQSLDDWRKGYQQSIIDVGNMSHVTPSPEGQYYVTDSQMMGYDALGQLWGAGAHKNPDMVWSDEFLNGYGGQAAVGHDLMQWDYANDRAEFAAGLDMGGDYGVFFGDTPVSRDPVQNMLLGMDMTVPPISENESHVYDGVRNFLASDTTFDVEQWDKDKNSSTSKLNMAEYLVGHRFDPREAHWSDTPTFTWIDQGEALGSALGAAVYGEGAETPEGATIASGFIDGYEYGLMHNDLTAGGFATDEESFGETNANLRTYAGAILGPYMGDIATQMQEGYLVEGAEPYITLPNGEVVLALSNEQIDFLIGREDHGLFSDLSRDTALAVEEGRPAVIEGLIAMAGETMGSEMESAKRQLEYANSLELANSKGPEAGAAERARLEAIGVDVDSLPTVNQAQGIVDRLYTNHGLMYTQLESATGEALMHAGMEQDRANAVKGDVASSLTSLGLGAVGKHIEGPAKMVWQSTEIGKQILPDQAASFFSTDNLANAQEVYKDQSNETAWTLNQMDTTINQRITMDETPHADMRYAYSGSHADYSDSLPAEYQFIPQEGDTSGEFNYEAPDQTPQSLQREQQLNYYNSDPWLNGWSTKHEGADIGQQAEYDRDSNANKPR